MERTGSSKRRGCPDDEKAKADVAARNSALSSAAESGNVAVGTLLLEAGRRGCASSETARGQPLMNAAMQGHVTLLME